MTLQEILVGESKNVEFKEKLPERSINYMKSVIAFANGMGGKIIFGIADKTREVVGVPKDEVFGMLLPTLCQIAASQRLFQILLYKQWKIRRSL